jgi:hypothetical protein
MESNTPPYQTQYFCVVGGCGFRVIGFFLLFEILLARRDEENYRLWRSYRKEKKKE